MNARSWGDFIAASQRDKLPLIAHPKQVYAEQRTQVIHKKLPKRPTDLNPVTAQYMDPVKVRCAARSLAAPLRPHVR